MLAAPSTDLGTVEDAVVVSVHLVEPRRGALPGAILGALNELISGQAASGRGGGRGGDRGAASGRGGGRGGDRGFDRRGLLRDRRLLRERYGRNQRGADEGGNERRSHSILL